MTQHEDPIIRRLIAFGEADDSIRVMLLTSSRCRPESHPDILSDYDIEIYATDPAPFGDRDEWFEAFGPVLATYREEPNVRGGGYTRLVQYEDGSRIDFGVDSLAELGKLCRMEALPDGHDAGYAVILDKDGLTTSLKPPTYRAYIPQKPTVAEYAGLVNEFWWDSTYIAKYLWRGDVMAARHMYHWIEQNYVRRMLEWSVEIKRGWSWRPGQYGRDIGRALDPETYHELIESYAGGEIEDLWESLSRTSVLFRKIAMKVGDALGFEYLRDLDRRVTVYHETIRRLDKSATREDLAKLLRAVYADRP